MFLYAALTRLLEHELLLVTIGSTLQVLILFNTQLFRLEDGNVVFFGYPLAATGNVDMTARTPMAKAADMK